jgi:hypothetical protein
MKHDAIAEQRTVWREIHRLPVDRHGMVVLANVPAGEFLRKSQRRT